MIRGLPGRLPEGERVLWQGAPRWRALARRAFHVRLMGAYLGFLVIYAAGHGLMIGQSLLDVALSTAEFGALAAVAVGLVALYAWRVGATTVYTITNRRVAIRMGVALPMTLNLPFSRIESAAVHHAGDGTGDIVLRVSRGSHLVYLILWPHARPWRFFRAEPMLRAIAYPDRVGQTLARALENSLDTPPHQLHAPQATATIASTRPMPAEVA